MASGKTASKLGIRISFALARKQIVAAAASALVSSGAFAAIQTWTGEINTDFENSGNWSGNFVPANDLNTDIALFTGPVTTNQPSLTMNRNINGLQFNTATGGWTLGGAYSIDIGGNGITTMQTSGIDTINATGVVLGATQNWNVGSGGILSVSSVISGSGALTETGNGTIVLTGSNTFSSALNVNSGILNIQNNQALGGASIAYVNSGGTLQSQGGITVTQALQLQGAGATGQNGAVVNVSGTNTYSGAITFASGTTTISSDGGSLIFSGSFHDSNTLMLTGAGTGTLSGSSVAFGGGGSPVYKSGTGTWNFASAISFTGSLHLDAGIVNFVNGGLGAGTVNFGGGTLQYATGNTQDVSSELAYPDNSSGAITIDTNGNNVVFASTMSGVNDKYGFTKLGAGYLALTGSTGFTGSVTISSGSLQLGNNTSTGAIATGDAITDNADFSFNRFNAVVQGTDFSGSAITGTGTLTQLGSGTTTLTASNSYNGVTTISAGILQVGNGGTSGTLGTGSVTDNATLAFNLSSTGVVVSNAISGGGNLTQSGSGSTVLTGSNSYGTTTISAGTLQIGNAGTAGTLGTGTVTDNSVLAFNRTDSGLIISDTITGSGSITQAGTGTTILTGTNSYGTTLINTGTLQIGNSAAAGTLGSGAVTDNATLAIDRTDSIALSNAISGSGNLAQIGTGTTTITTSNAYTGATSISAGILNIQNSSAIGSGTTNGPTVNSGVSVGGTLQLQGGITIAKPLQIAGLGASGQNGGWSM